MTTVLTLDLGTGSARAALVDDLGHILCIHSNPLKTLNPKHGWIEQRPADWWHAIKSCIAKVLIDPRTRRSDIAAVCCCGQMHATIPVQSDGRPVFESVALWNDKRTARNVQVFSNSPTAEEFQSIAGNPATSAWPAFKFAWYKQNFPEQISEHTQFLLPKDFINYQLTGKKAIDRTEAGSSFLFDSRSESWSSELCLEFGIDPNQLPQLMQSSEQLGVVNEVAARQTGLRRGLPVIVGAGDYPAALLGSGMTTQGQVSDITGTSFLLTAMRAKTFQSSCTMNVADAGHLWGAFAVVDAAGDSVRWARRFLNDDQTAYAKLLTAAGDIAPGCDGLLYLPYLTGERFGDGTALTGNILNLTTSHGSAHLHRAVMEGVAFAMRLNAEEMFENGMIADEIICAGGGSKASLWNKIKATILNRSMRPTAEPEAGLIGTACLAFAALDREADPYSVAKDIVKFGESVEPDSDIVSFYSDRFEVFKDARSSVLSARK